jgi:hypothetical protein
MANVKFNTPSSLYSINDFELKLPWEKVSCNLKAYIKFDDHYMRELVISWAILCSLSTLVTSLYILLFIGHFILLHICVSFKTWKGGGTISQIKSLLNYLHSFSTLPYRIASLKSKIYNLNQQPS